MRAAAEDVVSKEVNWGRPCNTYKLELVFEPKFDMKASSKADAEMLASENQSQGI